MTLKIIKECREREINSLPRWKQAIKIANLNDLGIGTLKREQLPDYLKSTNGKTWARIAERYFIITFLKEKSSVILYEFQGFKQNNQYYSVPLPIRKEIKKLKCSVLASDNDIETDHKYEYHLYDNPDFNIDIDNYQPLSRNVNSKKREERRKRNNSGFKFDNGFVNCAFRTVCNTQVHNPQLLSCQNPFDGDYWTDPKRCLIEDRRYYSKYFNLCREINSSLTFEEYEKQYLPIINNLIKSEINIQNQELIMLKINENLS